MHQFKIGGDYSEYFEWLDGNAENQERIGYFVELVNNKIRIASGTQDILGIISATPVVTAFHTKNTKFDRVLVDEFGRVRKQLDQITYERPQFNPDTGQYEMVQITETIEVEIPNPNYNSSVDIQQDPAWAVVGMIGQIRVRDDGTCQPGSYCKCNENGIATSSENGYYVMDRIDENVIRILFK